MPRRPGCRPAHRDGAGNRSDAPDARLGVLLRAGLLLRDELCRRLTSPYSRRGPGSRTETGAPGERPAPLNAGVRRPRSESDFMRPMRWAIVETLALCVIPASALADEASSLRDGGVSALWILANLTYAGMRAQGSTRPGMAHACIHLWIAGDLAHVHRRSGWWRASIWCGLAEATPVTPSDRRVLWLSYQWIHVVGPPHGVHTWSLPWAAGSSAAMDAVSSIAECATRCTTSRRSRRGPWSRT